MRKWVGVVALLVASPVFGQTTITPAPVASITYVGVDHDVTDFQSGVAYGREGFWFAQFDASSPRSGRPTDDNEVNGLPAWAGPLTHMLPYQLWKFPQRTFSQDGPTTSKGGQPSWNYFTLPNGAFGLSGVILDPHAAGNTSQTVNRIDLGPGTPASFLLRIVVDNTDLEHDAIGRIRARGVHNGTDIDPASYPQPGTAAFNGVADVYTFRYDGFGAGDFIKIQFVGMPGGANNGGSGGSSFAGLLFDLPANAPQPSPSPSPSPQPTASPQPSPSPQPTATGTTSPGSTATSGPAPVSGGGGGGGGCALAPRSGGDASALLLLLLLGGLALGRSRAQPA